MALSQPSTHLWCPESQRWMSPNGPSFPIHSRDGGVPVKRLGVLRRRCIARI
jgi:hypothetical protein